MFSRLDNSLHIADGRLELLHQHCALHSFARGRAIKTGLHLPKLS